MENGNASPGSGLLRNLLATPSSSLTARPTPKLEIYYKASQARNSVSAYVNAAVRTLDLLKKTNQKTISTAETIREALADSGIRENAFRSMNL
jgi:hypothetical protein